MASVFSNYEEIISPNPLSVGVPVRDEGESMVTEDDSFSTIEEIAS